MGYSTDLTPEQRNFILENFPEIFKTKSNCDILSILNSLFYLVKTGCQWKMLPSDAVKWRTVYEFYRKWTSTGVFEKILLRLNAHARQSIEKKQKPTLAVIDSQSIRSGLPQSTKGVDGGKKIKGIKRHLAVDSNGFLLAMTISAANVHDSKAAHSLIPHLIVKLPSINLIKADNGYRGKLVGNVRDFMEVEIECVKSNFGTSEFRPISGRWVVERTFAWLENFRRLNRNYERFLTTAKSMALAACILLMLRYV